MPETRLILNTPDALCGGKKPFAQCEPVQAMLEEAANIRGPVGLKGHKVWTRLAYLSRKCMECDECCVIRLASNDGQPTGEIGLTFTETDSEDTFAAP